MFPLFRYGEPCVEECASSGKIKWSYFWYLHDIHDVRFSLKIQERITFGAPQPALGISAPRRQPPLFKTFLRWIHKFVKERLHGILKLFQDGHICSGMCDKMGGSEHFCEVEKSEGFMSSWWDYCSPKEWEIYVFSVRIIIPDYCSPKVDKVPWKMDFCGSGLKILISQIHWKCAFY